MKKNLTFTELTISALNGHIKKQRTQNDENDSFKKRAKHRCSLCTCDLMAYEKDDDDDVRSSIQCNYTHIAYLSILMNSQET